MAFEPFPEWPPSTFPAPRLDHPPWTRVSGRPGSPLLACSPFLGSGPGPMLLLSPGRQPLAPASPLCLCRAPRFDSSSLRPLLCPFGAQFWVFQGLVLFLGYELLEGDKPTNSSHLLSFHSVPDNISVCCIHFICKWVLMLSNEGNKT